VLELNSIQFEWIMWNLRQENKAMKEAMGQPDRQEFSNSKDTPSLFDKVD